MESSLPPPVYALKYVRGRIVTVTAEGSFQGGGHRFSLKSTLKGDTLTLRMEPTPPLRAFSAHVVSRQKLHRKVIIPPHIKHVQVLAPLQVLANLTYQG